MNSLNKNSDPFKQFVKSKLDNYKEVVPPSGWERLESSLFATQKTIVMRRKWVASSVAAVAAAMIGVFFVFQNMNKELPMQTSEQQTIQTNEQLKPFIAKEGETTAEITPKKPTISLLADNIPSSQRKKTTSSVVRDKETALNVSSDNSLKEKESFSTPAITTSDKVVDNNKKSSEIDEQTKQQMIDDFIKEGNRTLDVTDSQKTKRRSRHSISLLGQSGLSSSEQTNTLPTTLRSSVSESYGTYTMGKMQAFNQVDEKVNSESETTHMQPVSFGLITSFDLTRKLQIETGLVYTYLSSETKSKSNDFNNSEKVNFHYLGVPLNLNYTLLSVNKLNLFVTAGAMIEKDISGKIKYNDEKKVPVLDSEYANESSSKIKQNNPQFSIASGVGITYPIYENAKLFGKVGGRYYIKADNEYKTYYSDEKFGLDIQLGIKFNF